MMYHPNMPGDVINYSPQEQRVAVLVGGLSSPGAQVRAQLEEKLFIPDLREEATTRTGSHILLESVLLVLGGGRHVILGAGNCNLEAIGSLNRGDLVSLGLVDPERRLSIGGGWAIDEVRGPNNQPLYFSPGYKSDRAYLVPDSVAYVTWS